MKSLGQSPLWRHIRYGSLTKTVYAEITPVRIKENNAILRRLNTITLVLALLLSALSAAGVLSRHVLPAYGFLLAVSLVFLAVRRVFPLSKRRSCYVASYAQSLGLLVFGMLNSAVFSPDPASNGTIFVVILLVIPFLLADIPLRIVPVLVASSVVYCLLLRRYKMPSVVSLDTVNTVFVCLISCMCNWIFGAHEFRSMANSIYIEKERDTDALTGLLTKHSARVLTETRLSHGGTGMLAMIDLDDFKHVNDTYGHLYGDEVLAKVAACIRESIRRTDIAARFGGDEFVIFYPDMDRESVRPYAEHFFAALRKAFAAERVQVTCSMGIQGTDRTRDYETLFRGADTALYESKHQGKNRFHIAD